MKKIIVAVVIAASMAGCMKMDAETMRKRNIVDCAERTHRPLVECADLFNGTKYG